MREVWLSEAPKPSASGQPDPEQQKTADKLAEFVAKHGRSFEEVTRQRNPHSGLFKYALLCCQIKAHASGSTTTPH